MLSNSQWKGTALRVLRAAFARYVRGEADNKGHFEVERKFALTEDEAASIPKRLEQLGFVYAGTAVMTDFFLPTEQAGEMMRVRQEKIGAEATRSILTLKKWVTTSTGKERQEAERNVRSSVAAFWKLLGRMVAGEPLLSFSKSRKLFDGKLGDSDAIVSVDEVNGLGSYSGCYMEIEVLVPLDGDVAVSRDHIFTMSKSILGESRQDVKQSYRDMLIKSRQA